MPDTQTQRLVRTDSVAIRDVVCQGPCRTVSAEGASTATHLVFTLEDRALAALAAIARPAV